MLIIKAKTYEGELTKISESMTLLNDVNLLNISVADTRKWLKHGGQGIVHMGYAARGDNAMSYWNPTNTAWKAQVPWNGVTPWFAASFGVDNQSVNTCINIGKISLQLYDYSILAWRKVVVAQNPQWCKGKDYSNGTTVHHGDSTKRIEADSSWSITINPTYGAIHGGVSAKYHIPDTIANYLDMRGIFVKMESSLALIDQGGVDDRHLAQILVSIGADLYPEITTNVTPDFDGAGYAPAAGISRWILIDSTPRPYYMSTINPPAIESNISNYVIGGGVSLMPFADFTSHLPPRLP